MRDLTEPSSDSRLLDVGGLALEVCDLNFGFGETQVLHGLNLQFAKGQVHAVSGENGSGKSTLLGLLSGRLQPWSGNIVVNGEAREFAVPRDAIDAGVALVSQELTLVPQLTIAENLGIGSFRGRSILYRARAIKAELQEFIDLVGLERSVLTRVADLSVHERQLVEIARALATGATTILLDEPTSSLDLAEVAALFRSIRTLKERGYTFLIITHRTRELYEIADTVSVLRDGHVTGTRTIGEMTEDWLVYALVGREMNSFFPERVIDTSAPVVLEVTNLTDATDQLDQATLNVRAGEIVALAGLVGAGRSELLETIYGARPRDGGEVRVAGSLTRGTPGDSLQHGVGMIFEERKHQGIVPQMTLTDNFSLSTQPITVVPRAEERKLFKRWQQQLSIKGESKQQIGTLSGGNQQKVLLARLLEMDPQVLLLDEPTRGVDIGAKVDIYHAIVDAAAKGCAVLLATSEIEEALGLAHRILVLREGAIVGEQLATEASEESIIRSATGLDPQTLSAKEESHG